VEEEQVYHMEKTIASHRRLITLLDLATCQPTLIIPIPISTQRASAQTSSFNQPIQQVIISLEMETAK